MNLSIHELKETIKRKSIDPFSLDFSPDDFKRLLAKYNEKEKEAESLIRFISLSNENYRISVKKVVSFFLIFPTDKPTLIKLLFRFCNHQYFIASRIIAEELIKSGDINIESQGFLEIEVGEGTKVHVSVIPQLQVDITAELLRLYNTWETSRFPKLIVDGDIDESKILTIEDAWHAATLIINLRDQCMFQILYDNCYPEWIDEKYVKIKKAVPVIDFIRTAANVRVTNHLLESKAELHQTLQTSLNDVSFEITESSEGMIMFQSKGLREPLNIAELAGHLKYHLPYAQLPLTQFNNYRLIDLVTLLENVVNAFRQLSNDWEGKLSEKTFLEIPISLNRSIAVEQLANLTGYSIALIETFLDSIVCDSKNPYFWKSPFYQLEEDLYFPIYALITPNFNLYIDKWLDIEGLEDLYLVSRFKEFLKDDLRSQVPLYDSMDVNDAFLSDVNEFHNNIMILTRDNALVLELVVYNYPVEYQEHEAVLEHLGSNAILCSGKKEKILKKYKSIIGDRKVVFAILSDYPIYGGLVINAVPVIDTSLLYNYFFTGRLSRASIRYAGNSISRRDIASIQYYTDLDSFNIQLENFLLNPMPVRRIVDNLKISVIEVPSSEMKTRIAFEIITHIGPTEAFFQQTQEISNLLRYEYYVGAGKEIERQIEGTIFFNLSSSFEQISYNSELSHDERLNLINATIESRSIGIAYLVSYLLKLLPGIKFEKKKDKSDFTSVDYDKVSNLIERLSPYVVGEVSLSDFVMPDIFTDKESKQLISMAIDLFEYNAYKNLDNTDIKELMLGLLILQGFRKKYETKKLFFIACLNMVDLLNQSHHYQKARDFCEEILQLCVKSRDQMYAWLVFFNCYTQQKNFNDSAIYGCLFFTSLRAFPSVPNGLFVSGVFALMKFLRNFGYSEYVMQVYKIAIGSGLNQFDKLKISNVYFSTLMADVLRTPSIAKEIVDFINGHIESIKAYSTQSTVPWLMLLYNLQRAIDLGLLHPIASIQALVVKLENDTNKKVVAHLKASLLGDLYESKRYIILALMRVLETRNIVDYVSEIGRLNVSAHNLIRQSIAKDDHEGIFLASVILSDQTLNFVNKTAEGKVLFIKDFDEKMFSTLSNYRNYLIDRMNLKAGQLLIWIFDFDHEAGCMIIDEKKKVTISKLEEWLRPMLSKWTENISEFYFNSKNIELTYYDITAQERMYEFILKEFSSGELGIENAYTEVLVCQSVELVLMPHNLIVDGGDFLASKVPVTNVVSLEYFADNGDTIYLPKNYTISAWIPADDGNMTINWGLSNLKPILDSYQARIYTQRMPDLILSTDINVFMAHGARDLFGFKSVRTADDPESILIRPARIFGSGYVAVLFICNSGSAMDDVYASKIVSLSMELLKMGYKAVISSFWPYDVSMASRWLSIFLKSIDEKKSVSFSVFEANNQLSTYDESSSTLFYDPAGRLSMHLYGSPNIILGGD